MFLIRLVGRFVGFVFKAVVFVAAMGAVAAAVMVGLFDADQYKRQVAQRVLDLTGRVVSIDSADLQLGLPPRIVMNGVRGCSFGINGASSGARDLVAAGPGPGDKEGQDPAENLAATPAPRQTATGTPRKN